MLKLIIAVLAVALAGTASGAGWKDLRVDGSSDAAFKQSLAAFNKELSPERQQVFASALMDIWLQGTADAKADQREFTVTDYQRQLDGLSYEAVVTFTDPTGKTAKERYREAKRINVANNSAPPPVSPWQAARNDQAARDSQMLNQGTEASPSPAALSGVPGIGVSTRNRQTSCGGNIGGCETQPPVQK